MKYYTTPEITAPTWQFDITNQPHVLIGGTTGSGKSVALNGVLRSLMRFTPDEIQLVLIDPKGVELADWEAVPHTLGRFCDPGEIANAIHTMAEYMENRFKRMKESGLKRWDGADVYIVIDEYVDIRLNCSKEVRQDIIRIACKGRAAGIHLIVCTQRPTRDIIDGALRACLPCILALRCAAAQESRNLVGKNGAEELPLHGTGLYLTPSARGIQKVPVPMIDDEEVQRVINHWKVQA